MVSKVILTLSAMVAVAAAVVPGGAGPWGAGGAGPWGAGGAGPWGAGGGWGASTDGWGANARAWGPNAAVALGAAGGPNPAVNPWIPPWISAAPWYPQWGPCTAIGSTCVDCNTKQVCTKFGGLQRPCSDPTLPHCNLGECSATPSAECAVPVVPANVAL